MTNSEGCWDKSVNWDIFHNKSQFMPKICVRRHTKKKKKTKADGIRKAAANKSLPIFLRKWLDILMTNCEGCWGTSNRWDILHNKPIKHLHVYIRLVLIWLYKWTLETPLGMLWKEKGDCKVAVKWLWGRSESACISTLTIKVLPCSFALIRGGFWERKY